MTIQFLSKLTSELTNYCAQMDYDLHGIFIGRKQYRSIIDSKDGFYWRWSRPRLEPRERSEPTMKVNGVGIYVVDKPEDFFHVSVSNPHDAIKSITQSLVNENYEAQRD